MSEPPVLRIAIPSPLRHGFDYLPPEPMGPKPVPGVRIEVPFGKRVVIGILLETAASSAITPRRLRRAIRILDEEPVLPPDLMALLRWASGYYHHPIGEVVYGALPTLLRRGAAARLRPNIIWRLTERGLACQPGELSRAPRQAELLELLQKHATGLSPGRLEQQHQNWRPAMLRLREKGLVEICETVPPPTVASAATVGSGEPPALNRAQQSAVDRLLESATGFSVTLLEGVTGSGKTEVYLRIVEQMIALGRQALILVPEIGLTPQLLERFARRFPGREIVQIHSALPDRERLAAWLAARDGTAPIIIGTRSALFTPLKNPGLIILDEEHDPSFKQQEGFRYSTRDMAIVRARNTGIPILLGSATPSLESLHNAARRRYRHLLLPERAGAAGSPEFRLLDLRRQPMQEGISFKLMEIMEEHLQRGGQVLLFLNRRGYAPTLLCHECGWVGRCH
ncbi:MAG TPA: primosomal protein N', partial [Gammaproteobacteria bacterium]|nr:primosomal protein N' [Gammaproteobacteria bacterium]